MKRRKQMYHKGLNYFLLIFIQYLYLIIRSIISFFVSIMQKQLIRTMNKRLSNMKSQNLNFFFICVYICTDTSKMHCYGLFKCRHSWIGYRITQLWFFLKWCKWRGRGAGVSARNWEAFSRIFLKTLRAYSGSSIVYRIKGVRNSTFIDRAWIRVFISK